MTDKTEAVAAIRRLVAEAGKIQGAKLALALKAIVPDWNAADFGARSLREFVLSNVEDVVIAGRSGMDVVYAISAPDKPASIGAQAESVSDAWRAWVSPGSPYALAFRRDDGSAMLIDRTATPPDTYSRIEPTSVEEHRTIAREFLDQLVLPGKAGLQEIVESPDSQWWRSWLGEIKKLDELASWNAFRHERLLELLVARLEAAGFDASTRTSAAEAVKRSRQRRPSRQVHAQPSRTDLSRVVTAVIGKMSTEDLRNLKLPIGLVLDVLDDMKS